MQAASQCRLLHRKSPPYHVTAVVLTSTLGAGGWTAYWLSRCLGTRNVSWIKKWKPPPGSRTLSGRNLYNGTISRFYPDNYISPDNARGLIWLRNYNLHLMNVTHDVPPAGVLIVQRGGKRKFADLLGLARHVSQVLSIAGTPTIIGDMPAEKQCPIVSRHALVLLGHGAGVPATLMCTAPKAVVIEVHPPGFLFFGFHVLSRALLVTHMALIWPPPLSEAKSHICENATFNHCPRDVPAFLPHFPLLDAALLEAKQLLLQRRCSVSPPSASLPAWSVAQTPRRISLTDWVWRLLSRTARRL